MSRATLLSISHATGVEPQTQVARERGLLAAAALGESHLHVSTLAQNDVLALGAFHRTPPGKSDVRLWRRHVGGRAVASGAGFTLVTIALPHRAALVADQRRRLNPEQVMNRCVRGILHALRPLGVDLVYPGLDSLTHQRRTVATMGFVEADGPTLFQVILATTDSFARGPALLDRADPDGVVPATLFTTADTETLAEAGGDRLARELADAVFAARLGRSYGETFGLRCETLDDAVTGVLADAYRDDRDVLEPPHPAGAPVRAQGRLGPVEAWATVAANHVASVTLTGDFIAPAGMPTALDVALRGLPVERAAVTAAVAKFLDRDQGYLLGLRPTELGELVWRSVEDNRERA